MSEISEIKVKNIDNLGIVAGLIDEIGIVEIINDKLGIDAREKISSGQVVKAILINVGILKYYILKCGVWDLSFLL